MWFGEQPRGTVALSPQNGASLITFAPAVQPPARDRRTHRADRLVDRDERSDEVRNDHGQDINRLYIGTERLSIGTMHGSRPDSDQSDAIERNS